MSGDPWARVAGLMAEWAALDALGDAVEAWLADQPYHRPDVPVLLLTGAQWAVYDELQALAERTDAQRDVLRVAAGLPPIESFYNRAWGRIW